MITATVWLLLTMSHNDVTQVVTTHPTEEECNTLKNRLDNTNGFTRALYTCVKSEVILGVTK